MLGGGNERSLIWRLAPTRAVEVGHVGEIPGLDPGQHGTLSLRLKPGHYVLICNMPGHYRLGQHVDFKVA